eukprot:GILI01007533.1.p1 GENE.GILI01007533.1~~GILI01007533.1.p1  ORF type:complete len:331 (-),score=118.81 GILI01007533.1:96-1088(-)
MSALEQLKKHSVVVADTADFGLLKEFAPTDATTNPSLILAGSKNAKYQKIIDEAVAYADKNASSTEEKLELALDKVTVAFGLEILKIIPGRVSTEVDAKLSFDTEASVAKARNLVKMYEEAGIGKDRLYIKLASTWEGIQAASVLEAEGVSCNLTLLFSFAQAVACAQTGVALISPFVGRIMDYYKAKEKREFKDPFTDPGVVSVARIYNYYKTHGYKTTVMGASFRNTGEIVALAGCDKITISPSLLKELAKMPASDVKLQLDKSNPKLSNPGDAKKIPKLTRPEFLFMHNEDPMAVEKLAEGIRSFNKDTRTLEGILLKKLNAGKSKL